MPSALTHRTTGAQLRRQRIRLTISVAAVARSFGCTRQNVQGIERSARVSDDRAQRYLDALAAATSPAVDPEVVQAAYIALGERVEALAALAAATDDRP